MRSSPCVKRTAPFLKPMDYNEMDGRFSNENAIKYNDIKETPISYDEIEPFLNRLPDREIDLIRLYYRERKNQKDIAKLFGVTQGAVSSRLARARKRLQFLRDLPKISDQELDSNLCSLFDNMEIEIIKHMMRTTCQSKTAELINEKFSIKEEKRRMTQVKVRHRFEKCLARLHEEGRTRHEFKRYYNLLYFLKKNLYLLHEVKLPHFDRGKFAVFTMNV